MTPRRSHTLRRAANPGVATTFRLQPAIPSFIDSSLVRPRASLSGAAITRQMASDMREAALREGGITRDDLEVLGWTSAQIDKYVAAAREQAQALSGLN
jgi:hypothetical protein